MLAAIQRIQPFRMLPWLFFGLAFYASSILVGNEHPQIQVALWKLGHVTMFSFVGYWIARNAIGRLNTRSSNSFEHPEAVIVACSILARALIIGCAILAANGL